MLNGASPAGYGTSWAEAAWLHARSRAIPVIMFTAHQQVAHEAQAEAAPRSQRAAFAAVVPKPFDLHSLLEAIACVGRNVSLCDGSATAEWSLRRRVLVT